MNYLTKIDVRHLWEFNSPHRRDKLIVIFYTLPSYLKSQADQPDEKSQKNACPMDGQKPCR